MLKDCDEDNDNGTSGVDADGDGIQSDLDCDDNDALVGIEDDDGDGYAACPDNPIDCDDDDPRAYPGAAPLDSISECMIDVDGDGYGDDSPSNPNVAPGSDCDDENETVNIGETDVPQDNLDQDCDGIDAEIEDLDEDGWDNTTDCDDENPEINPGIEFDVPLNGIDEDCKEGDSTASFVTVDQLTVEPSLFIGGIMISVCPTMTILLRVD